MALYGWVLKQTPGGWSVFTDGQSGALINQLLHPRALSQERPQVRLDDAECAPHVGGDVTLQSSGKLRTQEAVRNPCNVQLPFCEMLT